MSQESLELENGSTSSRTETRQAAWQMLMEYARAMKSINGTCHFGSQKNLVLDSNLSAQELSTGTVDMGKY